MIKKYSIYMRYSSEKQDFEAQSGIINGWIETLPPGTKLEFYRDAARSGKTVEGRDELKRLIEECKLGLVDTIVVSAMDRLARDASMAIKLLLDLDSIGVGFLSVSEPILSLNKEMPFRRTILSAFAEIAEMERKNISTRVKAAMAAAKKNKGRVYGNPTKINQQLVDRCKKLRVSGLSYRDISRKVDLSLGFVHKLIKI